MKTIRNWRGELIEVVSSKGGTIAVVNPTDNLITANIRPWPPPEIIQKLYKSRQIRAYEGADREAVTAVLGYYSDLQSLHSEDAITWSVFGPVEYSDPQTRRTFTKSLLDLLALPSSPFENLTIWLWRRIPHPDTLVLGGPEVDFGIETDDLVIFGEAKWLSAVGGAQGKAGDKDQITLRSEFFEKYGRVLFGAVSKFVLLGVSLEGGIVKEGEIQLGNAVLYLREMTWHTLCHIDTHPLSEELRKYLEWKKSHSRQP